MNTDLSNQSAPVLTHTCDVAQFRDSNDANRDHRVSSNTFDLLAAGRQGSARVTAKVNGYWSTDVITLYVERSTHYGVGDQRDQAKWVCTMSHSSGGRLKELSDSYPAEYYTAVISDLDAEMNFGAALISLAKFGREILQHSDFMEETYQIQRAAQNAAREADKASAQAKVEADTPLGVAKAKGLVAEARASLQMYAEKDCIHTYHRGDYNPLSVTARKTSRVTWYFRGAMIGEDALIAKLAEMSCRTTLS